MTAIAILISVICASLIGVFLYLFFMRAIIFWCKGKIRIKLKYVKIFTAVISLCLALFSLNLFSIVALIILHIVVFALVMELLNLFIHLISAAVKRRPDIWNKIYKSGLVPVVVTVFFISYGCWNIKNVKETYYMLYTEKSLSAEGLRVLLIADLHYGNAVHLDHLEEYCAQMSEENPDIVVLCGDIVDENTERNEMEEAFRTLGRIKNKSGIFYVFGNHDKAKYRKTANYTEKELRVALEENNIILLEDEVYQINDSVTVVGRKDRSDDRQSIEQLVAESGRDRFVLVLDHQPMEYEQERDAGVDLLLSGHTHAGQIWPAGLLIEPLGFADLLYGHQQNASFQAIVTSGISAWGYPVRTEGRSEFVVIDIVRK